MSTEPDRTHQKPAFLKRVRIRNYKSIKFCDVELEPLTVLVGRNGSGKSNFVDALGFLRDVVTKGMSAAMDAHGGRARLLHGGGNSGRIEFAVEAEVFDQTASKTCLVWYEVAIDFPKDRSPTFAFETGRLRYADESERTFRLKFIAEHDRGRVNVEFQGDMWPENRPLKDFQILTRPFLGFLSDPRFAEFERLFALVRSYNFVPHEMRDASEPRPDEYLDPRGAHLPSAIETTRRRDGWLIDRVRQYLEGITGAVQFKAVVPIGGHEILQFGVHANGKPFDLSASSMSDGTLRALAALVAVFQETYEGPPSLVTIEEPETSLHPAATAALVDALHEATGRTQVLITTHSTELLDNPTILPENVRVVEMVEGETLITRVNAASVTNIAEGLNTLGGLERQDRLKLNRTALRERTDAGAAWRVGG